MGKNKSIGAVFLYSLKFALKWLWLFTMFLLGLLEFCFLIFDAFEYSYSFSELDSIEMLFLIFLSLFSYKYIKLCFRIKSPLVRKIITPWVDQAHLGLLCMLGMIIANQLFDVNIYNYFIIPMFEIITTGMTMMVMVYSYVRLSRYNLQLAENLNASDIKNSEVVQ